MVHEALAAAEAVAADGISVEVIDLRTVAPLDMAPILESVRKTSRLLIAHEAAVPFGIGAEIAAVVAREALLGPRRPDRAHRRRRHARRPTPPTSSRPGSPTATTSPPRLRATLAVGTSEDAGRVREHPTKRVSSRGCGR